ncbi:hypothetical protein [Microbacterium hominis]|uniref:Uncharacterized protein n=1 Tax=Microbacterium hominis TaxID=162426 RepID=A0A7D4THJ8_9MICO|nr:hypothetical protein [Microbacterium hominis]QKJ20940.1 hypothetical protein HQM25_17285 [Microbacterium hominis]
MIASTDPRRAAATVRWALSALFALAVVVGLVGMHALSVGHVGMPMDAAPAAVAVTGGSAEAADPVAVHAGDAHGAHHGAHGPDHGADGAHHGGADLDGDPAPADAHALAMLCVLALLSAMLLAIRPGSELVLRRAAVLPASSGPPATPARRWALTLEELSLLRT